MQVLPFARMGVSLVCAVSLLIPIRSVGQTPSTSPLYTVEEIPQPDRAQATSVSAFSTTGNVAGMAYVVDYPDLRPMAPRAPGAKSRDGNTGRSFFDKDREYNQDNIDLIGFAFLLLNPQAVVDFYKRDIYEGSRVGDVGRSGRVIGAQGRAFVTDGKRAKLLPAPGLTATGRNFLGSPGMVALGINKHGWAVGTYPPLPAYPDTTRAFVFRPDARDGRGESLDLGTLGGTNSVAFAISDDGLVVGDAEKDGGIVRAFVWDSKGTEKSGGKEPRLVALPTLGGVESHARFVNERGQIVGWAHTKELMMRACVWENGQVRALSQPDIAPSSYAAYISDNGHIAGRVSTAPNQFVAAVWDSPSSPYRLLGTLGGPTSESVSINSRGEAIGMSDVTVQPEPPTTDTSNGATGKPDGKTPAKTQTVRHPFVYRNGKMFDLNTALRPGSKWEIIGVARISDNGVIAAIGRKGKETRTVLLRPVE